MHSGRIIANVTEQTTTEMMGVNLETKLIRSNLYSLHGAAKDARPPALDEERWRTAHRKTVEDD